MPADLPSTKEQTENAADRFLESGAPAQADPAEPVAILQSLKQFKIWSSAVHVAEKATSLFPESSDCAAAYIEALRALERHEQALQYLSSRGFQGVDLCLVRQSSTLLCEAGDFQMALEVLRPATSPVDASNDLLNLEGWAHQNSYNSDHGERGMAAYRRALDRLKKNDNESSISARTDALESVKADGSTERLQEELWLQKGYANALRRISGRSAEAEAEYRTTISLAENARTRNPADSFPLRIIGWCLYRLGDLGGALKSYKEALDAGAPRLGAPFDYGLILFSMGRVATASQQYATAIRDTQTQNVVRRCGLLRVAIFEFCDALETSSSLRQHPRSREILEMLLGSLAEAGAAIRDAAEPIAKRVIASARAIASEVAGRISAVDVDTKRSNQIIDWACTRIVGFENPQDVPCGLFVPVLKRIDFPLPQTRFMLVPSGRDDADQPSTATLVEIGPELTTAQVNFDKVASPATRILYVSGHFLKDLELLPEELSRLHPAGWQLLDDETRSRATCVELAEGNLLLDQLARRLMDDLLARLRSRREADEVTVQRAQAAVFAARSLELRYQTVLCFVIAKGMKAEAALHRTDAPQNIIPATESLVAAAIRFRDWLSRFPEWPSSDDNPRLKAAAEAVLERAKDISLLPETGLALEAIRAAAEVQLLVPADPVLEQVLAQKLSTESLFYLTADREILALAREPAFYAAFQPEPKRTKPAVDVFRFFKAPAHFSRMTSSFQEGPIAARARYR